MLTKIDLDLDDNDDDPKVGNSTPKKNANEWKDKVLDAVIKPKPGILLNLEQRAWTSTAVQQPGATLLIWSRIMRAL